MEKNFALTKVFYEKYVCFALLHEKFLRRRNTGKKKFVARVKNLDPHPDYQMTGPLENNEEIGMFCRCKCP